MSLPIGSELLQAANDLTAALSELQLTPIFIGGLAVSAISKPRFTEDVDALIIFDPANADHLLSVLHTRGFVERFSGMIEHAKRARMITILHTSTSTTIDLSFGCMPFEDEVLDRSILARIGDIQLRLPTPEDLIIMKAIANRPKDREDITNLAANYPNLDLQRIEYWVTLYAELLENSQLWPEIKRLM